MDGRELVVKCDVDIDCFCGDLSDKLFFLLKVWWLWWMFSLGVVVLRFLDCFEIVLDFVGYF